MGGDRVHKLAGVLSVESSEDLYRDLVSHWPEPQRVAIGGEEPLTALTDPARSTDLKDFVARMMYMDLVSYLPDDIMAKVDRATMAVSLESRAPFLDHRVVEFAWRLPMHFKVRDGVGKWILRQVLKRHVPSPLFERPKMGFGVPIDRWLRGPLRDWAGDLLAPARLRQDGFFDEREVSLKWKEHQSGARNWQYLLWDVLMFQAWLDD
jgi:asparagine synthase (glutamine-hydrolysing)